MDLALLTPTRYQRLLRDMVNKHLGLKFENVFEPPEGSGLAKGDVAVLRNVLYCDFMTQGADNQKYEEVRQALDSCPVGAPLGPLIPRLRSRAVLRCCALCCARFCDAGRRRPGA